MLYECAIDPESLYAASRSRRDFRDFVREFSIGQPIVISDYPQFKRYKSLIRRSIPSDLGDNDLSRLEELIAFIRDGLRVKRSAVYDRSESWNANLTNEAERIHFDHVLTTDPKPPLPCCTLEQLCEDNLGHPRQLPVRRTAKELSAAISNMLRLASKVVFVDPYFRDSKSSWAPFVEFSEAAVTDTPSDGVDLEVLFNADAPRAPTAKHLANKFRNEQPGLLDRCRLTFKALEQTPRKEKLHNRYVLTDIGGIFLGVGLAEEDESHRDDVSLLVKDLYELRWQQYALLSDFRVVEECEV